MAAPQPQATPAPAYTPFVTDLWRLVRAPFVPRAVFEEQRERPTVWVPWVIVSVLFMIVSVAAIPYTLQVARIATQAQNRPWTPAAESLTKILSVAGVPIGILIGLVIGAVVLYLSLMVTGSHGRFKGLMCICIFAAPITFLQTLTTTVVLMSRGVDAIQTTYDARITFGLDNLLSPEYAVAHRAMAALLGGFGPFEIWGLVITAVGLMSLERIPRNKAWTVAVIAFLVGLLVKAGFTTLSPAG